MRNIVIFSFCALILSACTFNPMVIAKGISVAKTIGSERVIDTYSKRQARQVCSLQIDSIMRLYGDNPTRLKSLLDFCGYKIGENE